MEVNNISLATYLSMKGETVINIFFSKETRQIIWVFKDSAKDKLFDYYQSEISEFSVHLNHAKLIAAQVMLERPCEVCGKHINKKNVQISICDSCLKEQKKILKAMEEIDGEEE